MTGVLAKGVNLDPGTLREGKPMGEIATDNLRRETSSRFSPNLGRNRPHRHFDVELPSLQNLRIISFCYSSHPVWDTFAPAAPGKRKYPPLRTEPVGILSPFLMFINTKKNQQTHVWWAVTFWTRYQRVSLSPKSPLWLDLLNWLSV